MGTINLAPEATCTGDPHTCGLTQPKAPKTPALNVWNNEHGGDLVGLLDWLSDEELLNEPTFSTRFKGNTTEAVCDFLGITAQDIQNDNETLIASVQAAMRYATTHGIPGLFAEFASSDAEE